MKLAKLVVCLGTVAMAWASAAKPYQVMFNNPAQIGTTELQPGAYSMDLEGDKAMIHSKKQSVEVPVKMQEGDQKYSATTVQYKMVDGKYRVDQIHLGGTKTTLIFAN